MMCLALMKLDEARLERDGNGKSFDGDG